MSDGVALLVAKLEEPRCERLLDLGVDSGHSLEPLVVLELADRVAVESDWQPWADRLRVDDNAARDERRVDADQGVDHALRLDASERPAAERDVETLALDVERLGAVYTEADALGVCRRPSLLHPLGIRVERVDARSPLCREPGEPALPATDVENADALQRDECLDPPRLDLVQVGDVHA